MVFHSTVKPLYSEQSRDPKKNVNVQSCSPKRVEICSCAHVHEIQCTHIKIVSLLLRDSSSGRAIFHYMFFLFISYYSFLVFYSGVQYMHFS